MVLKFGLDPQTGVVVPPVTVFNGGKRKAKKTRKGRKGRKASKKTMRRRR